MPVRFFPGLRKELGYERVQSFRGGMNGFDTPALLKPDESQYLTNMLVPDNLIVKTRPGADAVTGGSTPAGGRAQGIFYFETPTLTQLIAAVNGTASYWNGTTWAAITGGALTNATLMLAGAQLVNKMFFSDGTAQWRSWDGATWSGALGLVTGPIGDPPVGATIIVSHTNRLFAAGVAGSPDTLWASNILGAGTGQWDHNLFSLRIGGGNGDPIVGLVSLSGYWLLVICRNSAHLVDANPTAVSAADWSIEHLPSGIGCVGKRAYCTAGDDCYFLAEDGIRSIARMESVRGQWETLPPLSEPVQTDINRINWAAAGTVCAFTYKQFVMFALPLDSATQPSHVLVFNTRTQSWMGIWTGWTPTCFAKCYFSGSPRLFFGDNSGNVNQWKDYTSETLTTTFQDNGADIASLLRTRVFTFAEPINNKDGEFLEMRFIQTETRVSAALYLDGVNSRQWTMDLLDDGVYLPVSLPFTLTDTDKPNTERQPSSGLDEFNECYLEISATAGKIAVKNITLAAFLNTVTNE